MRFALVDLSKLLFAVELHANSILENVLDMLLLGNNRAVLILSFDNLLEISWVTPGNLNGCRSLRNVRKDPHCEWIFLDLEHVSFKKRFVELEAILILVHHNVSWSNRCPSSFLSEVVRHCPLSVAA